MSTTSIPAHPRDTLPAFDDDAAWQERYMTDPFAIDAEWELYRERLTGVQCPYNDYLAAHPFRREVAARSRGGAA